MAITHPARKPAFLRLALQVPAEADTLHAPEYSQMTRDRHDLLGVVTPVSIRACSALCSALSVPLACHATTHTEGNTCKSCRQARFVRRTLIGGLTALSLLNVSATYAQGYPTKTVRFVVTFAAAVAPPIFSRALAQRLQEALGQSFVVENRPGAGSIIGTDIVAKSPPDGYTLLLMSNTHTVNESLVPKKPFTLMKDLPASRRSTIRTC